MRITDTRARPYVCDNVHTRRFNEIIDMMNTHGYDSPALMFGERAPFEKDICKTMEIDLDCTDFDLDCQFPEMPQYNTLFCCELIEHLLNPLWFLRQARELMTDDSYMYVTYPIQPHRYWSPIHFHEYDRSRFLYLLRDAKLDVVDYKEFVWWKPIKGIRPIIRNTPIGWRKQQIYVLKRGL